MPSAWSRAVIVLAAAAACEGSAGNREAPSVAAEPRLAGAHDAAAAPGVADSVPTAVHGFCHTPRLIASGLQGGRRVAVSPVATLVESGVEMPLRCVIRSRERWQGFRSLATPGALSDSAADFPREALLVAAMASAATRGMRSRWGR
ncbi:MAG TPA: hypothetical protein VFS20_26240 [Longimicrobium sp.]|nr:hypothetical protein [Longimicrobium sp.]